MDNSGLKELAEFSAKQQTAIKPIETVEIPTNVNNGQVLLIAKTHELVNAEGYTFEKPSRIKREEALNDIQSFINYVNDFINDSTRIFASIEQAPYTIKTYFDYHTKDKPNWLGFSCTLMIKLSDEFKHWLNIDRKWLTQDQFAEHLKDFRLDIITPPNSEILGLVINLEATSQSVCASKLPTNEGMALRYDERIETTSNGKTVSVPDKVILKLPIFKGGSRITIECEFRFKIQDKRPVFSIRMLEVDKFIIEAVKNVIAEIEEKTGKKVFF